MKIGKIEIELPVVQGGMGVGVSLSKLAGTVSLCGGLGTISAAQIGFREADFDTNPIEANLRALKKEIIRAKEISGGKPVAVNIMVVTQEYGRYVKSAVEAGADAIISGAGLPMELPELCMGSDVCLAPIVSSKRALVTILRYWRKKYNREPDFVIVEGPLAGGHLGFSKEQLDTLTVETYDNEVKAIIDAASHIPVVVAGGVYTAEELKHYKKLGAVGVQLATRFVTTYECDAHMNYKQAYIDAKKSDICIVKSPVGLPGRAIHNEFLDRVAQGERFFYGCRRCITTCDPKTTPYCITRALINAVTGRCDEGLLFCGSNAYRAVKLEHVKDIMEEFRL